MPSDSTNPFERYGWLLWSTWMIFLVFPVVDALGEDSSLRVVGGLVGVAAFAGVYVIAFRGLFGRGAATGASDMVMLIALSAIAAATGAAIGLGALSFLPFLASFGMFGLRRPLTWWWSAALVVFSFALPLAAGQVKEYLLLVFILIAVSLGTGTGRVMSDLGQRHERIRDELTLTAERDRVARDVHDVLGHSLTVVSVKAQLAERMIDIDPERARAELVEIQALTRQALAEVRATVGGLRAAGLDDEVAAAGVALRAAGITADLPTSTSVLDPRRRTVAAWVLREAVTNVVRHSGAQHCVVTLEESRFSILDDGRCATEIVAGNGLRGLTERVAGTGGELRIGPTSQGGTELEVTW